MLDLDYDIKDVVERLKELKVEEYSETKIDKDDVNPPVLFVFGKDIDDRLIIAFGGLQMCNDYNTGRKNVKCYVNKLYHIV